MRPGPIQGGMVHPYLKNRANPELVTYPKPELRNVLERTLGVPLFQEQAMQIAIDAAGFEPAKADKLRRAMATFRRAGTIHKLKGDFIEGMVGNGYERAFAERCFKQIEGFGEYGFPESHAASFAILVYDSSWVKHYYPEVFAAALLNSQPMGFYAPAQLVRDAREHGVEVRPPDVNASEWDCTLESGRNNRCALRLGLRQVAGLSEDDVKRLVERRTEPYRDPADLWRRSRPLQAPDRGAGARRRLRLAGPVAPRRAVGGARLLRCAPAAARRLAAEMRDLEPAVALPALTLGEQVVDDYAAISMSLRSHPLALLRPRLSQRGVTPTAVLANSRNDDFLTLAGLVLVRQRPGTASGVVFVTIEDEHGIANLVVWPRVFEAHRRIVMGSRLLAVRGRVQREGLVIHLVAERLWDWSAELDSIAEIDDFHLPTAAATRSAATDPGVRRDPSPLPVPEANATRHRVRKAPPAKSGYDRSRIVLDRPKIKIASRDFH